MKIKDRFIIRVEIADNVNGKFRTINLIDTKTDKLIDTVTVPRIPFGLGKSKERTELENKCRELNALEPVTLDREDILMIARKKYPYWNDPRSSQEERDGWLIRINGFVDGYTEAAKK